MIFKPVVKYRVQSWVQIISAASLRVKSSDLCFLSACAPRVILTISILFLSVLGGSRAFKVAVGAFQSKARRKTDANSRAFAAWMQRRLAKIAYFSMRVRVALNKALNKVWTIFAGFSPIPHI